MHQSRAPRTECRGHLLLALIQQKQSDTAMLLSGLNVTIQELVNDLQKELRTIPTVSGTNADVYFSPSIKNAFFESRR